MLIGAKNIDKVRRNSLNRESDKGMGAGDGQTWTGNTVG